MDKTASSLQLRDIHLPGEPSVWPLAIGWWLLIALALVVLYFLIKKLKQRKKLRQSNSLLQSELRLIRNNYKKHQNKHKLATDISALLNRFVKYILADNQATSLTGEQWIEYLNSRAGTKIFSDFKTELTQAQYDKSIDFDVPRLLAVVKNYFPKAINNAKAYNKSQRGDENA